MSTSQRLPDLEVPLGRRNRPPVRLAFAGFSAIVGLLWALAMAEISGIVAWPIGTSTHLGTVAGTTFATSGLLAIHRAIAIRNGWAAAIAAVLVGPGAVWSWASFVADGAVATPTTALVVVASGVLACVLLALGLRLGHWLEVFGGLGCTGLAIVAGHVLIDPTAVEAPTLALLAAVAGMISLYGLLVDLELSEHRSLLELIESRRRVEHEVAQVEDLLHDLRGGLLAIEAAIGSFDGDLAGPLQSEAARLRRLTLIGARSIDDFDLVARVENLVAARRAAGVDVHLEAGDGATAWGEESEVLAIVDNLVANAERHGEPGPIEVRIVEDGAATRLSVRNRGRLPPGDPDAIFGRGVTTHPDGQGLGLARARMLAEVNGADLRVGPAESDHISFVLRLRAPSPVAA